RCIFSTRSGHRPRDDHMTQIVGRSPSRPMSRRGWLPSVRRYTAASMLSAGALALVAAPPSLAQQPIAGRATITGTVRDAISEAPIPGATVGIPNTSYQALTDSAGRYTLRNVPMGNQTIDAKRIGYSQAHDE